ncbi:acyl-CoA dehydrogenase family protein [Herpetosiphon giganteus]|uniref:acyl-CoA dehydrogenase family protein n=1 Tax=Herpetosiphon giganteus TaxID=2029754 RepID=UPI00195A85C3|nr:acyl-CoA dehydrogenase family protein [Herpetosiphon giganteus]MBM7845498.1 alkylation response protein AidB-like acyl-CoA dehydrogenase [Herpetosiphon giganteus]
MAIDVLHSGLTERQQAFVALGREMAALVKPSAAKHDQAASFPFEHLPAFFAAKYQALSIPTEFGGLGASLFEAILAQEQLAYGDGSIALVLAMPIHVLGGIIEGRAWQPSQIERLSRLVVEQSVLLNSAASEREMGSPARGGLFATTAQPVAGGWLLNGRKIYTTGAPALTHALISATIVDTSDTAIFLVDLKQTGVTIEPTWHGTAMRAARNDDIVLEGVVVAEENLLQRRQAGVIDPSRSNAGAWFQLNMAAVYLGIAQAARDVACNYARERRPTALAGKAISELESIQRQLGKVEQLLLSARSLLYQTAQIWEQAPAERGNLRALIATTKATAIEHAVAAVEQTMIVVGGASLSPDLALERYARDVRAGLFHPPTLDAALVGLGSWLVE